MKAVIIGTSGHIDLALAVRDRATTVTFVGIAPGSADEDAKSFFVDQLEAQTHRTLRKRAPGRKRHAAAV